MNFSETIGLDMSKETFDVRIHTSKLYDCFENNIKGFKKFISWLMKNCETPVSEVLIAFEHTGLYSHQISLYLAEQGFHFVIIPGLEIKRSLGISRGKNDKIDATQIALYAYRLREEIVPTKLSSKEIIKLKNLISLREQLVKQRAGFKARLREQKRVLCANDNKVLFEVQKRVIKALSKEIQKVESEMYQIVKNSKELNKNFKLINSIKGVGPITAVNFIAITNNFSKFKDSRKFASYCGIAPFPNQSGKSLKGKTKVSHLANKKIKTLLDLCAKTAIQHNPEMKLYYNRRIDEGKNRRSTINIIRNKLVSRIFAVVQRGSVYVDIMKYAA